MWFPFVCATVSFRAIAVATSIQRWNRPLILKRFVFYLQLLRFQSIKFIPILISFFSPGISSQFSSNSFSFINITDKTKCCSLIPSPKLFLIYLINLSFKLSHSTKSSWSLLKASNENKCYTLEDILSIYP